MVESSTSKIILQYLRLIELAEGSASFVKPSDLSTWYPPGDSSQGLARCMPIRPLQSALAAYTVTVCASPRCLSLGVRALNGS